jgi:hypothetical protein
MSEIPAGARENANYITCAKGHKVFVVWSPQFQKFAFTCDECDEHSVRAISPMTGHVVEVRIIRRFKVRPEE